jgi:hypothetical protein
MHKYWEMFTNTANPHETAKNIKLPLVHSYSNTFSPPVTKVSMIGPNTNIDAAIHKLVLANKKLLVTLCFFCKCPTNICCADVLNTPTLAATVPVTFISTSETVATATPAKTTMIACTTFLENFLFKNDASNMHMVGICASLQTW